MDHTVDEGGKEALRQALNESTVPQGMPTVGTPIAAREIRQRYERQQRAKRRLRASLIRVGVKAVVLVVVLAAAWALFPLLTAQMVPELPAAP